MGFIIELVAIYAPWIYAICGLVALYQVYQVWLVRAERRQAVFSLEREKAIRDTYNIFMIAFLLLVMMGFTYFTSTTLATAIEIPLVPTATPLVQQAFVVTPTNTPGPAVVPSATPLPALTTVPTTTVEAAEVPIATAPPPTPVPPTVAPRVQPAACPNEQVRITSPGNNEVIRGVVNILGTASHDQLQYYKLEYAPGANATSNFIYWGGGSAAVFDSILTSFDSRSLSNGAWTLQLIVVDQTGNFPDPCQVTINIQN